MKVSRDKRGWLSLLLPIALAQERASFDERERPYGNHYSQRYHSSKRLNQAHHSKRFVVVGRMPYVWGAVLLFLALSLATLDSNRTSRDPVARASGQASTTGGPSFSYSSQWGSYGGPIMPNGVAVDSSGNVYIADAKNYAIVKLASSGLFVTSWGSYGTGTGQFRNPEGIALDASGNVFVSDSVNNNVQKFTDTGGFVTSWNTWNKTSTLKQPFGLSVNATGFLYV